MKIFVVFYDMVLRNRSVVLILLISSSLSSSSFNSARNTSKKISETDDDYGLLKCANQSILTMLNQSKAGILRCAINDQTHIADVNGRWGFKSWMNDLYFGLNGGLYISDERQQNVFIAELRKISKFVLEDTSRFEIVPYAVDAMGKSCDRNPVEGIDYDRCAEFVLNTLRVYEFTGNVAFLEEMYPVNLRIIHWLKKQNSDSDMLIEGRSLPAPISGVGSCSSSTYIGDAVKNDFKDFGANLLYYQALQCLARTEIILGKRKAADGHNTLADSLRKQINKIMWNEDSKGYLGWIDKNDVKHADWITGNNTQAIDCGLADSLKTTQIMERLNENSRRLIDIVPCRSRIDTFAYGYSSNPANYYWNGGCWPLIAAPVILAYRKTGNLNNALHVINVLSTEVARTRYGFYESYWGNDGEHNGIEGLLMNNGGVLWGFYGGVMGINVEGDALIFQDKVPGDFLPAKARIRYRGADIMVHWVLSNTSFATLNGKVINKVGTSYILYLKPKHDETIDLNIGVTL